MNDFNINMIKSVPNLYKKQIIKMIEKHNEVVRGDTAGLFRDKTEFEKLLVEGTSTSLLEVIKKLDIQIEIDSKTPYEILSNHLLMSVIIEKNPSAIQFLSSNLLSNDIIKQYEDNLSELVKNGKDISNLCSSVPGKCLENKKVCDILLKNCNSYIDYQNLISKIAITKPEYLEDAIEYGQSKGFKISNNVFFGDHGFDNDVAYRILSTKDALEVFDNFEIDSHTIKVVYDQDHELAKKILIDSIENDLLYHTNDEMINDPEIINIIFDYNCQNKFKDIYSKIAIDYYTPEIIKKAFVSGQGYLIPKEVYERIEFVPVIAEVAPSNLELFDINVLVKYICYFDDVSLCEPSIIKHVIYRGRNNGGVINSPKFLNFVLELLNKDNLNPNEFRYKYYLLSFDKESFTNENLDLLIEIQKKFGMAHDSILDKLSNNAKSDQRIFDYLLNNIDGKNAQYLLAFDESVINANNIKILIDKLDTIDEDLNISTSMAGSSRVLLSFLYNNDDISKHLDIINKFKIEPLDKEIVNILFNKLHFGQLIKLDMFKNNLKDATNLIDITQENCEEKLLEISEYPVKDNKYIAYGLWIVREVQNKNITSERIESLKKKILDRIKQTMLNLDELEDLPEEEKQQTSNDYISKVLDGSRNPVNFINVRSKQGFKFMTYISDFETRSQGDFVDNLPMDYIDKVNPNHINHIIGLLIQLKVSTPNITKLAINIYSTLGYEKAIELLSNNPQMNYGNVNENNLESIFNNINLHNIVFRRNENGFIPVLNNQLLSIIFGKNNGITNNPIGEFLNDCADKRREIQSRIDRIKNDFRLSPEEKEIKINELHSQLEKHRIIINEFFKNIGAFMSNWNTILEEFKKKQNTSPLELNIPTILEIFNRIRGKSNQSKEEMMSREIQIPTELLHREFEEHELESSMRL